MVRTWCNWRLTRTSAWGCCLWLLFLRPLATIAVLRAGAPGGLFTPTMTFGALLGATFGEGWSHVFAGADKRSCALLGTGAVLAAATQAPISSVAFMLELTYNASTLMVPLLLAVAGATFTYPGFESRNIVLTVAAPDRSETGVVSD